MSGWPSLDPMDDRRLAQSLATGDADALAQVFDGYAARLFDYCHALLRDQQSATDALHDSLLAAFAHISRLREQERFRSWLYALVRNECMRRLRDPARPPERQEAPEVEDVFLDAEERGRQQETRQLVHSALSGLNGRQREALDLLLRHDLAPLEIGGVLGISTQEATDLTGQARAQLDDALAAAMIARTGRDDCPSVAALVDSGDWPLTTSVCRKLIRHIATCPTCGEHRKRRVSTGRLLQVLPIALMPADLRGWVLSAATMPDYAEQYAAAVMRAEPFDPWGWPTPVEPAAQKSKHGRREIPGLLPAIAAAAAVVVVVSAAYVWLPGSPSKDTGSLSKPKTSAPGSTDPAITAGPTDSETPSKSPSKRPRTATPTIPTTTPTIRRPARPPRTRTTRPRPPTNTDPPEAGTVQASGQGCTGLAPGGTCSIIVRAVGGPVTWSGGGSGGVGISPGGGRLSAGSSRTVTATAGSCPGGSGAASFAPGGDAVSVTWTCPP